MDSPSSDPDPALIAEAWPRLSTKAWAKVLAIVREAIGQANEPDREEPTR